MGDSMYNKKEISLNMSSTNKLISRLINHFPLIGLIIVITVFTILTSGAILQPKNLVNIFNNVFSIGLISVGVIFLMSMGCLDLSVGAMVGASAAISAIVASYYNVPVIITSILTGTLFGVVNGFIVSYLGVDSFIATLSISFVLRGLTTWMLNGTVGAPFLLRTFDNIYIRISIFIVIIIALFLLYDLTSYGKHCRSIGSSSEAAFQSGVKVKKTKMIAFVISGIMCGLVAFFLLSRTLTASSNTGSGYEFDVLLAVLFGGITLTGGWTVKYKSAVIGVLSMSILLSGMSLLGITGFLRQIVQGVVLIIVVVLTFDRRNIDVIK